MEIRAPIAGTGIVVNKRRRNPSPVSYSALPKEIPLKCDINLQREDCGNCIFGRNT